MFNFGKDVLYLIKPCSVVVATTFVFFQGDENKFTIFTQRALLERKLRNLFEPSECESKIVFSITYISRSVFDQPLDNNSNSEAENTSSLQHVLSC